MTTFFDKNIFLFLAFLTLIGCGEDALYSKSETNQIYQSIYIVPEFFSGNSLSNYSSARVQTIDQGQTIKFWASYLINEKAINNDEIANYPIALEWTIGNESYNVPFFTKTFKETGSYDAILTTTDFFQDTLRDTVTIQVNTPIKIKAVSPEDGYNLLDVTDSAGITLRWSLSGNDPWDDVTCFFYASRVKDNTWNNFVDTVKCEEPITIRGPFEQDNFIIYHDTSLVYYWGIKVITNYGTSPSQRDSTSISSFRTRLKDNPLSIIEVPFKYQKIDPTTIPHTRVDLISASGEILASDTSSFPQKKFYFKDIPPQNGLIIKATNLILPEYKTESVTMDVIAGSYNVTPEILFIDSIAPERAPLTNLINPEDSIVFKLKDLGSGINAKYIHVILNNDTLEHQFSDTLLSFAPPKLYQCHNTCELEIEALDYAANETSLIHWTLSSKDTFFLLEGPFPLKELQ